MTDHYRKATQAEHDALVQTSCCPYCDAKLREGPSGGLTSTWYCECADGISWSWGLNLMRLTPVPSFRIIQGGVR
jgi:hypothetical protein